MFFKMPTPDELANKSLNTNIQWLIIRFIKLFVDNFVALVGITYLLSVAGIMIMPTLEDIAWFTIFLILIVLTITFISIFLTTKLQSQKAKSNEKKEAQEIRSYPVTIRYLGKTKPITISIKGKIIGVAEEELLEKIMDDYIQDIDVELPSGKV